MTEKYGEFLSEHGGHKSLLETYLSIKEPEYYERIRSMEVTSRMLRSMTFVFMLFGILLVAFALWYASIIALICAACLWGLSYALVKGAVNTEIWYHGRLYRSFVVLKQDFDIWK